MKFYDADNASDMAGLANRHEQEIAAKARKSSAGRWIIYEFTDESGKVVFQKCRIPLGGSEKTFKQRHWAPTEPHGYKWEYQRPREGDRLIYHLPQVLRAKTSGAVVWWTEGEKDADRLEEELEGDDCTTTHIDGAGNSTPEQAEHFRGHTGLVVLLMDRDKDNEHGRNPGAYCVIKRYEQLRGVGLKRSQICVAAPAVGKDVYDHLSAGHGLDELVWITDLTELRAKYELGAGFSAWNYRSLPEIDHELQEGLSEIQRNGWHPKVEKR